MSYSSRSGKTVSVIPKEENSIVCVGTEPAKFLPTEEAVGLVAEIAGENDRVEVFSSRSGKTIVADRSGKITGVRDN